MEKIVLLGAGKQAATSFALAYPERRFVFVTDCPVIDGWDLANVEVRFAPAPAPADAADAADAGGDGAVALCPRWIGRPYPLSRTLPVLERVLPGQVVPVSPHLPPTGRSAAKGDLWHRPDAPAAGERAVLADLVDPHGCGLVFQPWLPASAALMVVGRRWESGSVALGVFRLQAERFFRYDVIQAAETIDRPEIVEACLAGLDALGHVGPFTLMWLDAPAGPALVGFRPVPRAVCGALRRAGVSLLDAPAGTVVAAQGVRSLSDVHYASYPPPSNGGRPHPRACRHATWRAATVAAVTRDTSLRLGPPVLPEARPMSVARKKVLVLSGIAAAINYIKALTPAADVGLYVGDADRFCPGLYAPGVHPVLLPRARERDAYRGAIEEVIARHGIQYLIPTSDYDMDAVMTLLDGGWTPPVRLFRPPSGSFRLLSHKYRLASTLGGRFPDHFPRTVADQAEAGSLRLPLVVKPAAEAGGKGVTIVQAAADLPAAVARLRSLFTGDILFQEFIPGDTWVLTMVYDHDGRLVVAQPMRSHQTFFTWGGGGCAGEIMDEAGLVELGARMVEAAGGWRGPLNLEWRRHEKTGRFVLMEANCRLNGYSYLTTMNGLDLPRIVLSLLAGEPLPGLRPVAEDQRVPFVLGYRERLVEDWLPPL